MKPAYNFINRYPLSVSFLFFLCWASLSSPLELGLMNVLAHYDKLVHFIIYTLFCTIVWYEYLRSHTAIVVKNILKGVVATPIIIGGVLEYMQSTFTVSRSGDLMDFLFNVLGVLFAALVGILVLIPVMHRHRADKPH